MNPNSMTVPCLKKRYRNRPHDHKGREQNDASTKTPSPMIVSKCQSQKKSQKQNLTVLVCLGCHNRIPDICGLKDKTIIFSQFWRLGGSRLRCQLIRLLVRTLFREVSSLCVLKWWTERDRERKRRRKTSKENQMLAVFHLSKMTLPFMQNSSLSRRKHKSEGIVVKQRPWLGVEMFKKPKQQ